MKTIWFECLHLFVLLSLRNSSSFFDFLCPPKPLCLHVSFLFRNPRVPCRALPDIDVSHWREEVTQCRVNGLDIALGSSRKISPCTSCTCTKEGVRQYFSSNLLMGKIDIHSWVSVYLLCFWRTITLLTLLSSLFDIVWRLWVDDEPGYVKSCLMCLFDETF